MANYHPVEREMSIPNEANRRFEDPSSSELTRQERAGRYAPRVIGGDRGDVYFTSYSVEDGKTVLNDCTLFTGLDIENQEEIDDLADQIICEAYDAIGVDCVH